MPPQAQARASRRGPPDRRGARARPRRLPASGPRLPGPPARRLASAAASGARPSSAALPTQPTAAGMRRRAAALAPGHRATAPEAPATAATPAVTTRTPPRSPTSGAAGGGKRAAAAAATTRQSTAAPSRPTALQAKAVVKAALATAAIPTKLAAAPGLGVASFRPMPPPVRATRSLTFSPRSGRSATRTFVGSQIDQTAWTSTKLCRPTPCTAPGPPHQRASRRRGVGASRRSWKASRSAARGSQRKVPIRQSRRVAPLAEGGRRRVHRREGLLFGLRTPVSGHPAPLPRLQRPPTTASAALPLDTPAPGTAANH
mmetsp:Transcript_74761/g.216053  ORF Transcript_74761/g.216053 Transcript_74761/m.216053 type:complete len:316 (-) Transcript_74761:9-956(-)